MDDYKPINKESNLRRYRTFFVFLGFVAAYFLYHLAIPYADAYYAKSIMRKACNEAIHESLYVVPEEQTRWRSKMLGQLRGHGINPDPEHYSIDMEVIVPFKKYRCTGQIAFQLTSTWGVIADFFEMKPFKTTHRATIEVDYKR